VQGDQALDHGQAQAQAAPGAGERVVGLHERFEDAVEDRGLDAGPLIEDGEHHASAGGVALDAHAH
jgi:hypothetical protein